MNNKPRKMSVSGDGESSRMVSSIERSKSVSEIGGSDSESSSRSSSRSRKKPVEVVGGKLAGDPVVAFVHSTGKREPGTATAFVINSSTTTLIARIQSVFERIKQRGSQLCLKYYADHQYWTVAVFDFNVVCVFKVFIINLKDPRTAILNPTENTEVAYKVDTKFTLGDFPFFMRISKYLQDSLLVDKAGDLTKGFGDSESIYAYHPYKAESTTAAISPEDMVFQFVDYYAHIFTSLSSQLDDLKSDIDSRPKGKPYTIDYDTQNQLYTYIQLLYSCCAVEHVREMFRYWCAPALVLRLFDCPLSTYTDSDVAFLAGSTATESFKKFFVKPPEHPLLYIYAFQLLYLFATTSSALSAESASHSSSEQSAPTLSIPGEPGVSAFTPLPLSLGQMPSSHSPTPSSPHSPRAGQQYARSLVQEMARNAGFMRYIDTVLSNVDTYPYQLIIDRMQEIRGFVAKEEERIRGAMDSTPAASPSKRIQRRKSSSIGGNSI